MLPATSTQETFRASLAPDLTDQVDQVMQRDRAFFRQHPDQDYSVRLTILDDRLPPLEEFRAIQQQLRNRR